MVQGCRGERRIQGTEEARGREREGGIDGGRDTACEQQTSHISPSPVVAATTLKVETASASSAALKPGVR